MGAKHPNFLGENVFLTHCYPEGAIEATEDQGKFTDPSGPSLRRLPKAAIIGRPPALGVGLWFFSN